jgi:uncharacterized protein YdaU (DUF1376 family)
VNYYERHLGDYAKDTAHLSLLEHGVYTVLLDWCYSTEDGIRKDDVFRIARSRSKEEREAVEAVLREFFSLVDGKYRQKRCDAEIERACARIDAARRNGRSGGRPAKTTRQTQQEPNGLSDANPDQTQQEPNGFRLGSNLETQTKALQAPVSRAPDTRSQSPITNCQSPDHSEGEPSVEMRPETRLDEVRSALSDFEKQSFPSKSPRRESKKPQNALEFEQINDRIERALFEMQTKGAPLNPHDYVQIAILTGLSDRQVRTGVGQLFDRGRLPIAELRRAAS